MAIAEATIKTKAVMVIQPSNEILVLVEDMLKESNRGEGCK
jgi:hypothetical protein